jgi:hypothetical protein
MGGDLPLLRRGPSRQGRRSFVRSTGCSFTRRGSWLAPRVCSLVPPPCSFDRRACSLVRRGSSLPRRVSFSIREVVPSSGVFFRDLVDDVRNRGDERGFDGNFVRYGGDVRSLARRDVPSIGVERGSFPGFPPSFVGLVRLFLGFLRSFADGRGSFVGLVPSFVEDRGSFLELVPSIVEDVPSFVRDLRSFVDERGSFVDDGRMKLGGGRKRIEKGRSFLGFRFQN